MAFPPGFLDEIRARVPIAEVIGRVVKLSKRGREFTGLCPFHNEKTPSFTVSEEKDFYHCFGCGAHGDVFKFLTENQGLSFMEAVERLASEAGLHMPEQSREDVVRAEKAKTLTDMMETAAAWFVHQLSEGVGADARGYVKRRGLSAHTQKRFEIGYAPDGRQRLRQALQAKGWSDAQLAEGGLVIVPEGGGEPYDRFRDRLMFPIRDAKGRCIAFGGRALSSDAKAKYLNSPETVLFHKGHTLFNIDKARKAAHKSGEVIVAEGYMDVIALAAAGFDHSVAPLGTALTEDQLRLLWRMADEPILCFDGDNAGRKAASRAVERALPLIKPGKSLRFALLPEGKDPDDLIKAEGHGGMQAILESSQPLVQMMWELIHADRDTSTPERRAALQREGYDMVSTIEDASVRHHYEQDFKSRVREFFAPKAATRSWSPPRDGRKPWQAPPRASSFLKNSSIGKHAIGDADTASFERIILATLLNHPSLLSTHLETLADYIPARGDIASALSLIICDAPAIEGLDSNHFKDNLRAKGLSRLVDELERDIFIRSLKFTRGDAPGWQADAGLVHTLAMHRRAVALSEECVAAEQEFLTGEDEAVQKAALSRLEAVRQEIARQNLEVTQFDRQLAEQPAP